MNSSKGDINMLRDPVCGMEIDEYEAVGKHDFEGVTYYFCAPSCKKAFLNEPERYINRLVFAGNSRNLNTHHKEKDI